MNKKLIAAILLLTLVLTSQATVEKDKWTVMVYMAAGNEREESAINTINELEEIGSGDGVNIVTLIDRWDGYEWKYIGDSGPYRVKSDKDYKGHGDWTGTKIYYIEQDSSEDINSKEIIQNQDMSLNSGDPKNLASFLALTQNLYPAEKYMVIIWGMSEGFGGTLWEADGNTFLETSQLGKVFQVALSNVLHNSDQKYEVVAFDSGFMSSYEICNELGKNGVKSLVGPEGSLEDGAFPYSELIGHLRERSSLNRTADAESVSRFIVDKYNERNLDSNSRGMTAVLLDEQKIDNMNTQLTSLANLIMKDTTNYKKLHNAADRSLRYYHTQYTLDLIDFMDNIAIEFDDGISSIAKAVKQVAITSKLIVASTSNDLKGISIYFPMHRRGDRNGVPYAIKPYEKAKQGYLKYEFTNQTSWDEMIEQYEKNMNNASTEQIIVPQLNIVSSSQAVSSNNTPVIAVPQPTVQSTSASAPSAGKYKWPTASHRITSKYGWRIHPVYGSKKMHWGIDIGSGMNTNISAPANGRVTYAKSTGSAGKMVIVSHGNGKETVYMHCNAFVASVGQNVNVGDTIARVGSTGASTGPHLHFETRFNDQKKSPTNYLE
ncbi:MAG: peptidoglycan DD-metalloendopeptidase family protein [Candidatus Muirbacterium halophilum]|nr:peptidoglycan DD-metalloendopeptidase family protein [Candidatus Muirbacterium halophilum]MCK9477631.1 peptidoglycan DD-metalloendopeptidase family protein [Candidatus Muirbacterium halophilum]